MKTTIKCCGCKINIKVPAGKKGRVKCPHCTEYNYIGVTSYEFRVKEYYSDLTVEKKTTHENDDFIARARNSNHSRYSKQREPVNKSSRNPSSEPFLLRNTLKIFTKYKIGVLFSFVFLIVFVTNFFGNSLYSSPENKFSNKTLSVTRPTKNFNSTEAIPYEECKSIPIVEPLVTNVFLKNNPLPTLTQLKKAKSDQSLIHFEQPLIPLGILLLIPIVGFHIFNTLKIRKYRDIYLFIPISTAIIMCAAWLLLPIIEKKAEERQSVEFFNTYLVPIENLYEVISPLIWQSNPLTGINDTYIASQIMNNLETNNIEKAVMYSALRYTPAVNKYAQLAHLTEAKIQFSNRNYKDARNGIYSALNHGEGWGISKKFERRINSEYALYLAKNGDFAKARQIKASSPEYNSDENFSFFVWLKIYNLELNSNLIADENSGGFGLLNHEKISELAINYWNGSSNESSVLDNYFRCQYAATNIEIAKHKLIDESPKATIDFILNAYLAVNSSSQTDEILRSAYDLYGIQLIERGEAELSITAFQKALDIDSTNIDVNCHYSYALMEKAKDYAFTGKFDHISTLTDQALNQCRIVGIEEKLADIRLIEAQWKLRKGELQEARRVLSKVIKSNFKEKAVVASFLERDSYKVAARYQKLVNASHWAGAIPRFTGSICELDHSTNQCTRIIFYNGERVVARANSDFSQVQFDDFNSTLFLTDTVGDGRFDTLEQSDAQKLRRIYEGDGDNLLDAEVIFDNKGNLIKNEKYSGRVLMKFPSGVIKTKCDVLSACDAYLVVKQNGQNIGKTGYIINNPFPSWPTAAVIDYKKGDRVVITMWDRDINPINPVIDGLNFIFDSKIKKDTDDILDTFLFTSLPETKIMHGMDGKAALEFVVEPTRLPLGMYKVDNAEYVNSFRYLNSTEFNDKTLQNIIEQAHKNVKYHEKTSLAASWVLPEIATLGLFSKSKIATQLLISFLGSEITYEILKNKEEN